MLVADSLSFSSFPVVFGLREMVINNWEGGFKLYFITPSPLHSVCLRMFCPPPFFVGLKLESPYYGSELLLYTIIDRDY